MDAKISSSSSDESLGSDEEDVGLGGASGGTNLVGNDSLLDSDDSSDSDSLNDTEEAQEMEVDEDALIEQLQGINDQLAANPFSYDLHGDKIKILKRIGDLDKLRETREKFSEMYPLAEQLWLDWLRDEIKLACTEDEKDAVKDLFERAVHDYLSVDIWLEYINFCVGRMGTESGTERCRETFERALGTCGLHVSLGSIIWDMYRDFEAALLGTTTSEDDLQAQESRFMSLCRRQLSVPLLGMGTTYEYVKSKIEIDDNTVNAYKKALSRLKTLETWEAKLIQQSGENKIALFREYIEDEKKSKSNPARIQCLYERAIAEHPLDSSIWLEYLDYVAKFLKIEAIALSVAERASRNCSWDVSVWIKYMALVELFCDSTMGFEKQKSVFEKAIMYCSSGEQAGTVWLKYLEFLKRKFDFSNPCEKELGILRKTFDAAEQHLLQMLVEPNEYISEILLFRARFEAQFRKGITEDVANLWKEILKRGYGQYAKTWVQYLLQETQFGYDIPRIRSHYAKAIQYVQDDLPTISNLWINFERDNGTLSSLQQCELKISVQMAKVVASLPAPASQEFTNPLGSGSDNLEKSDGLKRGKKRNFVDEEGNASPKKVRRSEDIVDSDTTNPVFKVPSIPPLVAKKKVSVNSNNNSTPHHGESVQHDSSKDNRTVFLSNLAFTTEENEIKQFFTDIGKIEEVRLAKDYRGRSKGFGYVCFASTDDARRALSKDRQPIAGRPAFVSKCDPDKTTRQKQFKYSTNLEKNKLFIKGLPFSLTADELRDTFKVYGDLKDCRLVSYRNGHSKGLAYVEYIDEACATQAILKADGMMIGDKKISVALSNPPSRDASKTTSFTQRSSSSSDPHQRRTPKVFVPRSLQVGVKKQEPASSNSAPRSNQQFRDMFLK